MSGTELPPLSQLAKLARLRIDAEESERLEEQLGKILAHFASLQELDVADVPATPYAVALENVVRDDGPAAGTVQELPRGSELVSEHAPDATPDGYRVPRVID